VREDRKWRAAQSRLAEPDQQRHAASLSTSVLSALSQAFGEDDLLPGFPAGTYQFEIGSRPSRWCMRVPSSVV
jgi:hypothetical protein